MASEGVGRAGPRPAGGRSATTTGRRAAGGSFEAGAGAAPAGRQARARTLATWLIGQRPRIDAALAARLGPAAPAAGAPETEALRRFRTFASASILRGDAATPALDGLGLTERRVAALVVAWVDAAVETAGPDGEAVRDALAPVVERFRRALRGTGAARRARGAPRAQRRAVVAAIDRVADAFLAVDVESGHIADANPAAGALLGVDRDALLGVDALSFVPPEHHDAWWSQLDATAEGGEGVRFRSCLRDTRGTPVPIDATLTPHTTRNRTLALILCRSGDVVSKLR